jgi:hypothetical protein
MLIRYARTATVLLMMREDVALHNAVSNMRLELDAREAKLLPEELCRHGPAVDTAWQIWADMLHDQQDAR